MSSGTDLETLHVVVQSRVFIELNYSRSPLGIRTLFS